jgi:hypothetical protein
MPLNSLWIFFGLGMGTLCGAIAASVGSNRTTKCERCAFYSKDKGDGRNGCELLGFEMSVDMKDGGCAWGRKR